MRKNKASTSSRVSLSGRSTQSQQIIARSNYNVVKSYGISLPVLVTEALTFSDRNSEVSINYSASEWAWVSENNRTYPPNPLTPVSPFQAVCGRRLLVWQFREGRSGSPSKSEGARRRGIAAQCRELTLPHCDIGHKASLIAVFQNEGQLASCLAVSPTGDVRYWPSIAHDGSSIDQSIGWEGQEFHELVRVAPLGYILATTTCNLVLLQLQLSGGRHQIQHKNIKAPSGFFGGIGKRFASIIIGMQSQEKENVSARSLRFTFAMQFNRFPAIFSSALSRSAQRLQLETGSWSPSCPSNSSSAGRSRRPATRRSCSRTTT